MKTGNVCRKHGISIASFYKWKAKCGGLEVSDARRLKTLEDEDARLKKLLAEAMLDNAMLRDIASRKLTPAQGEKPSLTCGVNLRSANGGRAQSSARIGPRCVIALAEQQATEFKPRKPKVKKTKLKPIDPNFTLGVIMW